MKLRAELVVAIDLLPSANTRVTIRCIDLSQPIVIADLTIVIDLWSSGTVCHSKYGLILNTMGLTTPWGHNIMTPIMVENISDVMDRIKKNLPDEHDINGRDMPVYVKEMLEAAQFDCISFSGEDELSVDEFINRLMLRVTAITKRPGLV